MKVLLTGATGYIGKRLLISLVNQGHHVVCSVRDKERFHPPKSFESKLDIIQKDYLKPNEGDQIPEDIQAAYFLMHSMSQSKDYDALEAQLAENFKNSLSSTHCEQVIYLGGISNSENLSKHLSSRKNVESILRSSTYKLTTLNAGIIIGSGSASFEIIRDLVEKLPIMVAPKWLKTKCQPIAIRDVLALLIGVLGRKEYFGKQFDIGGPDILNYKEMLLGFAEVRNLKRRILTVPVMTPKLSSYWLYFVTSTSYMLAGSLVNSMKIDVICKPNSLAKELGISPLPYKEALKKTLAKIKENDIASSWKDAKISGGGDFILGDFIEVPEYGCFRDKRIMSTKDPKNSIYKIWSIGGKTGYYYGNFLWKIRGFMDQLVGGVGLRRGRTSIDKIEAGDAIDFWRVLYAEKSEGRLLLFAEMKLPGEAWLEFKVQNNRVIQTATFRPHGLAGRLYWYSVLPFHALIFNNMLSNICK